MKAPAAPSASSALQITARVGAGLLGGYTFVWGFTALGVAASVALGMDLHDAERLFYLFAFLILPVGFGWAFIDRSLARAWAVLLGVGSAMTFAAWVIARAIT